MARIQVNIRFLYEGVIYADTLGYIPRHQAIKIPELRVQENETRAQVKKASISARETNKPGKGKKQEEIEQENDEGDNMDMDVQDPDLENEVEPEGDQIDEEEQPQIEEIQNLDNEFDNDNDNENEQIEQEEDVQIEESNEADDLSEISRSFSPNGNYGKYKTKRQKGQLDNFLQLPLKKPRKDAKKFDEATELIKKEEKERKRRQYIKKLMEAQQKATFDKILNETGRKFRQRQQKQQKEVKEGKVYKTLGNVPKITTKKNLKEVVLYLNRTQLFEPRVLHEPNVRMSESCAICHQNIGKYKAKSGERFCSVTCFKRIEQNTNKNRMCA